VDLYAGSNPFGKHRDTNAVTVARASSAVKLAKAAASALTTAAAAEACRERFNHIQLRQGPYQMALGYLYIHQAMQRYFFFIFYLKCGRLNSTSISNAFYAFTVYNNTEFPQENHSW
jgi:hypothetical protein